MNYDDSKQDLDFYRNFYDDMRYKDDDFLVEHFETIGREEGRHANLQCLIQDFEKRGILLPHNFDNSVYLALNEDVRKNVVRDWQATVHYLYSGIIEQRPTEFSNFEKVSQSNLNLQESISFYRWRDYLHLSEKQRDLLLHNFSTEYYLAHSPDLRGQHIDLFEHFMYFGWKEHRDPNSYFSTSYYVESNADIAASGMNPFVHYYLHGQMEGRNALPFDRKICMGEFKPLISVIVPNYNHAQFIENRLQSIFEQTYRNIEVIILDDASTDDSVEVILNYLDYSANKAQVIVSEVNSGSPFRQWRRGFERALGDLVWICESDDFCDRNFLESSLDAFRDDSVLISFGRIQFADRMGLMRPGLDDYRDSAESNIWLKPFKWPAAKWFRGPFGQCNVIPNVGGCLIRRQPIDSSIWEEAGTYRIVGDWYLYLKLSRGGQIAYNPGAIAYFRQHEKNTSVSSFVSRQYYVEHERILKEIRTDWGAPTNVILKAFARLYETFSYAHARDVIGDLGDVFSYDAIMRTDRSIQHLLICIKGFHLGGGEIFPIHLANALTARGYRVSLLVLDTHGEVAALRETVSREVAIYDAQYVREQGIYTFISGAGIDLIHSHYVGLEFFFFDQQPSLTNTPYVVTLHGSYESTSVPDGLLMRIIKSVQFWTFLTPANLSHLRGIPLDTRRLLYLPNGMPMPTAVPALEKRSFGIQQDATVFCLASRAIREKGWQIAINAVDMAKARTGVPIELLLVGDGPVRSDLLREHGHKNYVHFLGFRNDVYSVLSISDILLLPTTFKGESFPLIIIQALQTGLPVIATDVGQIRQMLSRDNEIAGKVIPMSLDEDVLARSFADAIVAMLTDQNIERASKVAGVLGLEYDIEKIASRYAEIYDAAFAAHNDDFGSSGV